MLVNTKAARDNGDDDDECRGRLSELRERLAALSGALRDFISATLSRSSSEGERRRALQRSRVKRGPLIERWRISVMTQPLWSLFTNTRKQLPAKNCQVM